MLKDFILPDIGEGIVECELVEWLVSEGDLIEEDQPVADVMTDKALVQIPAPHGGRVAKLYYQQGDSARVHQPLFAIELDSVEKNSIEDDKGAALESEQANNSEDFILPDIGEGIVECEVVEWLVAVGDHIEEDQPVVDVMTDKALVQIPARTAGVVTKIYCPQGELAEVHQPLFAVLPDGHGNSHPEMLKPTIKRTPMANQAPDKEQSGANLIPPGRVLASPAVRRICREHELNIIDIPGTGKDGRVLKEDVLRFQKTSALEPGIPASAAKTLDTDVGAGVRIEPIRGVKAAMARQMTLSAQTIPHFTFGDEVDVTDLLRVKAQLKGKAEQQGVKLTLMAFLMKALAIAVRKYPLLNSRVNDDCSEIHYLPECNIGMAVDSESGLLLPNIKGVDRLSILEIAAEVQRLAEAARKGRVAPNDLQGGTISISNIGSLGGTYAVPIINPPEVAIVALGKVQHLPRFNDDGKVEARSIIAISWSGDHRVIDGGTMARFSGLWQSYLEDPASLLLDIS